MLTFVITMAALKVALSLMPLTRMAVMMKAMAIAGRSNQVPVLARRPVVRS